jgi:hypothetical protein
MSVGVAASGVPRLAPMKPELHITTKPASARCRRPPILPLMNLPPSIRITASPVSKQTGMYTNSVDLACKHTGWYT